VSVLQDRNTGHFRWRWDGFECFGTAWDGIWDVLKCKKPNVDGPWDGGTAYTGGGWVTLTTECKVSFWTRQLLLRTWSLVKPWSLVKAARSRWDQTKVNEAESSQIKLKTGTRLNREPVNREPLHIASAFPTNPEQSRVIQSKKRAPYQTKRKKSKANQTYPDLSEPIRTLKYFWGVGKKKSLRKPNQAYESLLKPSNILDVPERGL